MRILTAVLSAGMMLVAMTVVPACAKEEKIAFDKAPKPVADAIKSKFPAAEILVAAKGEAEDKGGVYYEIGLKYKGARYDVSLSPEGKFVEIEKGIAAKDLPAAVSKAIEQKYAGSKIKKAEELTREGKISYEALLVTADGKTVEIVLDAGGKVLEEAKK